MVPAPLNFFYSHSYLMAGYYDPLLVTGLQADYKLNDNWTAIGGFNRGWQLFENPNDTLNFLGGVKWASDDKKSTLSVMVTPGRPMTFAGFHDVDKLSSWSTRTSSPSDSSRARRLPWAARTTAPSSIPAKTTRGTASSRSSPTS